MNAVNCPVTAFSQMSAEMDKCAVCGGKLEAHGEREADGVAIVDLAASLAEGK